MHIIYTFKLPVNLHSLSLLCVEFKAKIGWKVHKFRSNWSQAAVVVVTLSENGVRTTLWGGVCPIYSSWGACQSVTGVEQMLHCSRAMRSTTESDGITIFTVGCKSWYAISHQAPNTHQQHPPLAAKTNQSFQTLSHTIFEYESWALQFWHFSGQYILPIWQ